MAPPRLILASASPRRRELLALLGLPFEVLPSRYEEPPPPTTPVALDAFVSLLAQHKAAEVAERVEAGFIIGADTLVTLDHDQLGVPLGKPMDTADAERMLRLLSGAIHIVYTGVVVIRKEEASRPPAIVSAAVRTRVRFRELSAAMIADYIATGEPMDKAGAYGAQGYAAPFIEGFEGDFYNVVGLPLCTLGRLLEQSGLEWSHYRQEMPPVIG
ncbi:MAG TPA: Maf family protein [Chthonomonadaceae bacterium]|nr:Maf family protein [Chthonomonadaceae bacterium]